MRAFSLSGLGEEYRGQRIIRWLPPEGQFGTLILLYMIIVWRDQAFQKKAQREEGKGCPFIYGQMKAKVITLNDIMQPIRQIRHSMQSSGRKTNLSTILYRLFPILLLPISFSFGTCPISIIQIIQNMLECNFCSSPSQDNYIYTECAHLICLPCASMKWDRKYSLRCCNTTTFLEEETCFALEKINQLQERPPKDSSKENIPIHSYATFAERAQPVTIKISKEEPPIKSRQTQHSIYVSEFEPKPLERQQEGFNDRRNEACLAQMQSILNEGVQRIKFSFEMYRKELERREEALLKDVYNKFSDQFAKYAVNEEDTKEFKERMNRMIADEMAGLNKISVRELEGKPDKILEKLEYNQLKMKEKLHRHYQLLK